MQRTTGIVLIFLVSYLTHWVDGQEAITNAQRVYEFLNYGPLGLLYGILPSIASSLNISEQCSFSLNHTIDALHAGELWANLSE